MSKNNDLFGEFGNNGSILQDLYLEFFAIFIQGFILRVFIEPN